MRRLALLALVVSGIAAAPSGAAPQNVAIRDACGPGPFFFCYSPQSLTVSAGDRVAWTNNSITPLGHTITRCTPAACGGVGGGTGSDKWTGSGTIHQGQTYGNTFTGAGTYVYYCTIHGYAQMHGTITVPGSPPPPPPPSTSPVISKLKLKKTRHHRETVSFTLSIASTVKVIIRRAGKTYRTNTIRGHAGHNSTSFGTSGLKHGRYTLTLTPKRGKAARASFAV
jgi:plastocyanin